MGSAVVDRTWLPHGMWDLPGPGIKPMSPPLAGEFFLFFSFFYCSGFCHTLKWNSHGFTCVPHPDPLSHLPLHPIPLGLPSAPGPSACLMHPTWAGDLFHPRYYTCFDAVLLKHPTWSVLNHSGLVLPNWNLFLREQTFKLCNMSQFIS